MPKKKKTLPTEHVVIILDKSGSMGTVRDVTISGFNEQIQTLKSAAEEKNILLTMYAFNHAVTKLFEEKPIGEVEELTRDDYVPAGMTAMLDAVGLAIDNMKSYLDGNTEDCVLFVIMSDGEENNSKVQTWTSVAERIQERQGTKKWTFTYMGSNQDLSKIRETFHLPKDNVRSYVSDAAGTKSAHTIMCHGLSSYMYRGHASASASFYDGNTKSVDDEENK